MREMLIGLEPATVLTMKGMRFVRHRPMRAAILLICCSLAACHRNDAENDVNVAMTLTAPGCPVAGEMPGWVQNAVSAVEGVQDVDVNMVFDPPWTPDRMSEEARVAVGWY